MREKDRVFMGLIYILLVILIWVVNGLLYGSAIWFFWRGVQAFPKKLVLLVWPGLLLVANVYFGYFVALQQKTESAVIEAGVVYQTLPTPKQLAFVGYSGYPINLCNDLCVELLLEGQVERVTVISDNLRKGASSATASVTFKAWQGDDCLDYPYAFARKNLSYAFNGYCVRAVDEDSKPKLTLVLDHDLNRFYIASLNGEKNQYRRGIAILVDDPPDAQLLAIQAETRPEVISLPLAFKLFSSAGMEGALKFDGSFMTRSLKRSKNEQIAGARRELLNTTLGFDLDGRVSLKEVAKLSSPEAELMIRKAFESGDEAHIESISAFARSYAGFPFLEVMRHFATDEESRSAYLAQGYIDRWMRASDPQQYQRILEDRKKQRAEKKARRQFDKAKRFCKLESRRDDRDCSQYESGFTPVE